MLERHGGMDQQNTPYHGILKRGGEELRREGPEGGGIHALNPVATDRCMLREVGLEATGGSIRGCRTLKASPLKRGNSAFSLKVHHRGCWEERIIWNYGFLLFQFVRLYRQYCLF